MNWKLVPDWREKLAAVKQQRSAQMAIAVIDEILGMTDIPATFPYSVTCAICGATLNESHPMPYTFIASARTQGWDVPDAVQNKPIKCPTHNKP